jgi:hypothetical protein
VVSTLAPVRATLARVVASPRRSSGSSSRTRRHAQAVIAEMSTGTRSRSDTRSAHRERGWRSPWCTKCDAVASSTALPLSAAALARATPSSFAYPVERTCVRRLVQGELLPVREPQRSNETGWFLADRRRELDAASRSATVAWTSSHIKYSLWRAPSSAGCAASSAGGSAKMSHPPPASTAGKPRMSRRKARTRSGSFVNMIA